jgi:hypothetical protein
MTGRFRHLVIFQPPDLRLLDGRQISWPLVRKAGLCRLLHGDFRLVVCVDPLLDEGRGAWVGKQDRVTGRGFSSCTKRRSSDSAILPVRDPAPCDWPATLSRGEALMEEALE